MRNQYYSPAGLYRPITCPIIILLHVPLSTNTLHQLTQENRTDINITAVYHCVEKNSYLVLNWKGTVDVHDGTQAQTHIHTLTSINEERSLVIENLSADIDYHKIRGCQYNNQISKQQTGAFICVCVCVWDGECELFFLSTYTFQTNITTSLHLYLEYLCLWNCVCVCVHKPEGEKSIPTN